jgi:hypothetical protein
MKVDFQTLFKSMIFLVVGIVVLILAQMWLHLFDIIIVWKLLGTLVLLGVLAAFLIAVKQDLNDEKKLRDDKYLD